MATISMGHHPELTEERVLEMFRSHFAGKYEIQQKSGLFQDFALKKSNWLAIGVRFRQGQNGATLNFTGFTPSILHRMLPALGIFAGIPGILASFGLMFLVLRPSRKAMEEELSQFILNTQFRSADSPDMVREAVPSLQ